MGNKQYHILIEDNKTIKKEGHFFKAGAFNITINNSTYNVVFEPVDHTIKYKIISNDTVITELIHPDYAPDCTLEDINSYLNNSDMQTLFIALCAHNICIERNYLKWIEDNPNIPISYEINQAPII